MKIYRYISFFELYDILIHQKLKFTKLALMDDKNEGLGYALSSYVTSMFHPYGMKNEELIKTFQLHSFTNFVSCWSKEKDLMAMWLLYSKDNNAIRVSTTFDKLKKFTDDYSERNFFLKRFRDVEPGTLLTLFPFVRANEMKYVDFNDTYEKFKNIKQKYHDNLRNGNTDEQNERIWYAFNEKEKSLKEYVSDPIFLKDKAYEYEHEVRANITIAVRSDIDAEECIRIHKEDVMCEPMIKGAESIDSISHIIHIPVDNDFIEEICFDPRMPEFQKKIYIEILNLQNDDRIVETDVFGSRIKDFEYDGYGV